MFPASRVAGALAAIVVLAACQTVTDPLPPQAALNFDITDSALSSQRAPLPAPQSVTWRVEEMTASNITGFNGTYSFLFSGPCSYQLSALAPVAFIQACRTSGLSLSPDIATPSASFRIKLSRLEVRAAARPDLTATADPDGDGIPNASDNCPIVANPTQDDYDLATETFPVGDACSQIDSEDHPTIPDQDLDGVPDGLDNCLWYPNPADDGATTGADTDKNGIGDACERVAPAVLLGGSMTVECDGVAFTTRANTISFFRLDFGRSGVLTCDPGFTGCTLDPGALKLSQAGSTSTFDCHQVP